MHRNSPSISWESLRAVRSPISSAELNALLLSHTTGARNRAAILFCALLVGAVIALQLSLHHVRHHSMTLHTSGDPESAISNANAPHAIGTSHYSGVPSQAITVIHSNKRSFHATQSDSASNISVQDNSWRSNSNSQNQDSSATILSPKLRDPNLASITEPSFSTLNTLPLEAPAHSMFFMGLTSDMLHPANGSLTAAYELTSHWMLQGSVGVIAHSTLSSKAAVGYHDTILVVNGRQYVSKVGTLIPGTATSHDVALLIGPRYLVRPAASEWNLYGELSGGILGASFAASGAIAVTYNLWSALLLQGAVQEIVSASTTQTHAQLGVMWAW